MHVKVSLCRVATTGEFELLIFSIASLTPTVITSCTDACHAATLDLDSTMHTAACVVAPGAARVAALHGLCRGLFGR